MKAIFALLITVMATTTFAAQTETIKALDGDSSRYETFMVMESSAKSVVASIDYQENVKTDCHGLGHIYKSQALKDGKVLVTKDLLMKTREMCLPSIAPYFANDGIKLTLKSDKNGSVYSKIIAPAGSVVTIEVTR